MHKWTWRMEAFSLPVLPVSEKVKSSKFVFDFALYLFSEVIRPTSDRAVLPFP